MDIIMNNKTSNSLSLTQYCEQNILSSLQNGADGIYPYVNE